MLRAGPSGTGFLAGLDVTDGHGIWANTSGQVSWKTTVSTAVTVAMSTDGHTVVAGTAASTLKIGTGQPAVTAGNDFAAGLGTRGDFAWIRDVGSAGVGTDLVTTRTHRVIVVRLLGMQSSPVSVSLTALSGG